jgi:hypothetical protein
MFFIAIGMLMMSNVMVGTVMSMVYYLGKTSVFADALIYGPATLIGIVSLRDGCSKTFIFSTALALCHGYAHLRYPFLNEEIGVNKSVDVWQDQIVHLLQSALFASIFFSRISLRFDMYATTFVLTNVLNVVLGYFCWGQTCHNAYVWVSLAPALASGLHFATGTLFSQSLQTAKMGFLLQGTSSIITFFLFKSSDDILKLFALCRFFEIYFIVPHYVGFFYSRYKKNHGFLQIIGVQSAKYTDTKYIRDETRSVAHHTE